MSELNASTQRKLIRVVYLPPALTGLLMLIYACVPHLYFVYNGQAHDTLSPLQLLQNTWQSCRTMLENATDGSSAALYFSYAMSFFVILTWLLILLYAVMAIASLLCSCVAFSCPPTDRQANQAKRWLQFFCPNRGLYVVTNLLPILTALFPYVLLYFYRVSLAHVMRVHYFGPPDILLAVLCSAANIAAFLCLRKAQEQQQMDMYQLYKEKNNRKR